MKTYQSEPPTSEMPRPSVSDGAPRARIRARIGALVALAILWVMAPAAFGQDHTTWRDYSGGADSAQYSALRQINRTNVQQLEVAWVYPTGDGRKYFFNPLMADGIVYVLA